MKFAHVVAFLAGLFLTGATANAQEIRLNGVTKKTYIAKVGYSVSGGEMHGLYCRAVDGVVRTCSTYQGEGLKFMFGQTRGKHNTSGPYAISFNYGRPNAPAGRYYLWDIAKLDVVKDVTFYADFAPGTVVVFPSPKVPMKTAIEYARSEMLRLIGDDVKKLKFIPAGAVEVSCTDAPLQKKACTVGREIDVQKLAVTYTRN